MLLSFIWHEINGILIEISSKQKLFINCCINNVHTTLPHVINKGKCVAFAIGFLFIMILARYLIRCKHLLCSCDVYVVGVLHCSFKHCVFCFLLYFFVFCFNFDMILFWCLIWSFVYCLIFRDIFVFVFLMFAIPLFDCH